MSTLGSSLAPALFSSNPVPVLPLWPDERMNVTRHERL